MSAKDTTAPATNASEVAPSCSLCAKPYDEGQLMVKGAHGAICTRCLSEAYELWVRAEVLSDGAIQPGARYRYHWEALYDDGSVHRQFEGNGGRGPVETSVRALDFTRVTELRLIPQIAGYPPVRLRVDPRRAEKAIKFWQTKQHAGSGLVVERREVLGVQHECVAGHAVKVFVLFDVDGAITISTRENT